MKQDNEHNEAAYIFLLELERTHETTSIFYCRLRSSPPLPCELFHLLLYVSTGKLTEKA